MGRIRVEYSRGEAVRYLSHLDQIRLWERAFRRAGIPVAYSKGFNPHPQIAFGAPLAVGVTSDQEYVDVSLEGDMEPEQLLIRLARQMPKGMSLRQAVPLENGAPSLMAVIRRAGYRVRIPLAQEISADQLGELVRHFLEQSQIRVSRQGKKGRVIKEIREGIFRLDGTVIPGGVQLQMELKHDNQGSVRPDEVVDAFLAFAGLSGGEKCIEIHRTSLLAQQGGRLVSPLKSSSRKRF